MKTTFFAFLAGLAVTYAAAVPVSTPQTSLPDVGNVAADHPSEVFEAVVAGGSNSLQRRGIVELQVFTEHHFRGGEETWGAVEGVCYRLPDHWQGVISSMRVIGGGWCNTYTSGACGPYWSSLSVDAGSAQRYDLQYDTELWGGSFNDRITHFECH